MERTWLEPAAAARIAEIEAALGDAPADRLDRRVADLIRENRRIHERDCLNLNPATNVMNPRAEAALASGLGTRPSLGHPGDKYETGLEAIEEIEVIAAVLARRVFRAGHAEIRMPSGSMANAAAFLATCRPGDAVIVPSPAVGGHVSHQRAGVAGLLGLTVHEAPVDAAAYGVDLEALGELARRVGPKAITVGGSLNLRMPPVAQIRSIADEVGARVIFDAAHVSGLIAGSAWPDPLALGADLMTMSTYKSLAGPPAGLVLTNDAGLAQRVDGIAHPGLTANFDVANTAALVITLLDWVEHGADYARAMVEAAGALDVALDARGLRVVRAHGQPTRSHQLAIDVRARGGGTATARRLRGANLLASAIGLPVDDPDAGLRLGTPELVRWGMGPGDMEEVAGLVVRALDGDPSDVAPDTRRLRRRFTELQFVRP